MGSGSTRAAASLDEHAVALGGRVHEIEVVRITGVGHLIHDSEHAAGRYLDEVRRFLDTYAPA